MGCVLGGHLNICGPEAIIKPACTGCAAHSDCAVDPPALNRNVSYHKISNGIVCMSEGRLSRYYQGVHHILTVLLIHLL